MIDASRREFMAAGNGAVGWGLMLAAVAMAGFAVYQVRDKLLERA